MLTCTLGFGLEFHPLLVALWLPNMLLFHFDGALSCWVPNFTHGIKQQQQQQTTTIFSHSNSTRV